MIATDKLFFPPCTVNQNIGTPNLLVISSWKQMMHILVKSVSINSSHTRLMCAVAISNNGSYNNNARKIRGSCVCFTYLDFQLTDD